jgi:simple sugar transport system substrate-binding protein
VIPGHAAPYLQDGSLDHGILWDPKDAGFGMVWMAKHLLEGGQITDGLEIPNIGAIQLDGNVAVVDAMLDITAENAEDLGF